MSENAFPSPAAGLPGVPTREEWLQRAVQLLRPDFVRAGAPVPEALHVSIGFPSTRALGRRIGECWAPEASRDGRPHLFVSPLLGEPLPVLAVLVHELVHAAVGTRALHCAPFRRVALAVGLAGRMTATVAGPALEARLRGFSERLGPFPHAGLVAGAGGPRQTTRLLKLAWDDCGYTVRTTAKWVALGLPVCPCGGELRLNAAPRRAPAAAAARHP